MKNYKDDFQDLLRSSSDISIHQRCVNSLLTEVYKCFHGFSPEINKIFSTKANTYNTRWFNVFQTNLEQIWVKFNTLRNQSTLKLTSWKPQIISVINHFSPVSQFYIPWKQQKTKGFPIFLEGIEMWYWPKMDYLKTK